MRVRLSDPQTRTTEALPWGCLYTAPEYPSELLHVWRAPGCNNIAKHCKTSLQKKCKISVAHRYLKGLVKKKGRLLAKKDLVRNSLGELSLSVKSGMSCDFIVRRARLNAFIVLWIVLRAKIRRRALLAQMIHQESARP